MAPSVVLFTLLVVMVTVHADELNADPATTEASQTTSLAPVTTLSQQPLTTPPAPQTTPTPMTPTTTPILVNSPLTDITINIHTTLPSGDDGADAQDLQPFRAASTGSSDQGGGTTPAAELTESTAAEIGSTEATKEEGHTEASPGEGTAKTEASTGQENPGTEKPNPGALQDDPPAKLQSPENNPKVTVTTSASGMDTTPAVATVTKSVNGAVATVTESSGAVATVTESSGINGTLEAPSVAASTDNGNSKLIDDPMIADGPLISNEIIRNFKDKVTNVSDSMANKASDAVGKLKKTLNDGRGSINNENLNPFPPTTPDGRNVKDGMMNGMNGLSNNIRNSMVNVSETMLNASGGKDGGNSGKNSNASGAESLGGLPKAANSSVNFARDTVLEEIGGSRNNSMNASNANGSRNPTKAFDGNRTNGSLSNGPHSNGSTYNASRGYFSSGELRNATMNSMANLTDQARSSLKARNAGSRFEAWRYWTVAVSVAVVSRF